MVEFGRNLKKFLNSQIGIFLICGLIGAIFFIYYFGIEILNFVYTDWLISDKIWTDVRSEYTIWRLILNDDRKFPFLFGNIVYPLKMPIAFVHLPILWTLIFKTISPISPENFQFHGFILFLNYVLMGAVAGILLKKLTRNSIYAILGSIIFLLSPFMLQRMFYHSSLTSHFIILLCIYFCLYKPASLQKNIIIWTFLLCFATVIHFYIVPIVFFFMITSLINDFFETKKIFRPIAVLAVSILSVTWIMIICGYFYGDADIAIKGFKHYSANINTFFNSMDRSRFLPALPLATKGQYEGFAYLGFGVILGYLFIIIAVIKQNVKTEDIFINSDITRKTILGFTLIFVSFFFALSPAVTLNEHTIVNIPIPKFIEDIWNVFRASGRMAWVGAYIITIFMIWAIYKLYGKKFSLIILTIVIIFQFVDLDKYFKEKGAPFKQKIEYKSKLLSPEWKMLAKSYKHFFFIDKLNGYKLHDIAYLAAENNLTINDYYTARKENKKIIEIKNTEWKNILENKADSSKIYLFANPQKAYDFVNKYGKTSLQNVDFNFYIIDNYVIGLRNREDFLEKYFKWEKQKKTNE